MQGLANAAVVPPLHHTLTPPKLAPPTRTTLAWLGYTSGDRTLAGLGIGQVQAMLGPNRTARHQQTAPVRTGHRERVNHSQVHTRDAIGVRSLAIGVDRDGDFGGHVKPEPARIEQQGDRPHLPGRVGDGAGQPHPQPWTTAGNRNPHPPLATVHAERSRVPADRHHEPAPPRKPRRVVPILAFLRRGEPSIGETLQHRPRTHRVELTKRARTGHSQLTTQLLIANHQPITTAATPAVDLQHTRPHVARGPKQRPAPGRLPRRDPQPHPSSPTHQPRQYRIPTPTPHIHNRHQRYDTLRRRNRPIFRDNTCADRGAGRERLRGILPAPSLGTTLP